MNHRLTIAAAVAVLLASCTEFAVINGVTWMIASAGAIAVVAGAGTLTRLGPGQAAASATVLAALAGVPVAIGAWPLGTVVVAVVVAACAATGWVGARPLRAFATLVTYLAAVLLYLNLTMASQQSTARILPSIRSLRHLSALIKYSLSRASVLAPPVPTSRGIVLMAAGGIALIAIVVDVVAVRLHKPAVAGLPLMVLYLAPIVTTAKLGGLGGAVGFLLAASGFLVLLAADGRDRLRGWGRVITVWHQAADAAPPSGAETGQLAATGRRIGFTAICLAVLFPVLLPSGQLSHHGNNNGINGNNNGKPAGLELPNPLVSLGAQLNESPPGIVLTYHTNAISAQTQYLQDAVLNFVPGTMSWAPIAPSRVIPITGQVLPPEPGLDPKVVDVPTQTVIDLGPSVATGAHFTYLPVPFAPAKVQIPGTWYEDSGTLTIYSSSTSAAGLHYTAVSDEVDPTPAQLRAAQAIPAQISGEYGALPVGPQVQRLRAIANQVTKNERTAYDKATALEKWFSSSGHFTYSKAVKLPDNAAGLMTFLTTQRRGFCQQFAIAMAVLARLVGIPSRIAVGFTAGSGPGANGVWTVTTADAHAWPELYFKGIGWLRFEPTPTGPGGQGTAVPPAYETNGGNSSGGGHTTGPSTSTAPGSRPSSHVAVPPRPSGNGSFSFSAPRGQNAAGRAITKYAAYVLLALLILAAATPITSRLVIRRRRWRAARNDAGRCEVAWYELRDDMADVGLDCLPSESPRAVARRASDAVGDDATARAAVDRISIAVERTRYANSPAASGAIKQDVTTVRRAMRRQAVFAVRWRARLMPTSAVGPALRSTRRRVGSVTGWIPGAEDAISATAR